MARSEKILYRVRRKLNQYWPETVQDQEIYDILQQGQEDILTRTRTLIKLITVDTVVDQESYDLLLSGESIVGSIKEIIWPEDWGTRPLEKNFIQWDEITRINVAEPTGQPIFYSYNNKKIYFYPVPQSVETINLWVYVNGTVTKIGAGIDPEIPFYWDKALELYAMSQFSIGGDMVNYLNLYNRELSDLMPLAFSTSLNSESRIKETNW